MSRDLLPVPGPQITEGALFGFAGGLLALLLFLVVGATGCTDVFVAHWTSLGESARVECYSGGKLIYEGTSSGKVLSTDRSDGWEFVTESTGHFVRVSGDCVLITVEAP